LRTPQPQRQRNGSSLEAKRSPGAIAAEFAWHVDPSYNQRQTDPHDLAVVVFDNR